MRSDFDSLVKPPYGLVFTVPACAPAVAVIAAERRPLEDFARGPDAARVR